jgi:hypothetical protein
MQNCSLIRSSQLRIGWRTKHEFKLIKGSLTTKVIFKRRHKVLQREQQDDRRVVSFLWSVKMA